MSSSSNDAGAAAASAASAAGGKKATASGAVNVQRRTWDRDAFEKKAAERLEKETSGELLHEEKAQPYRSAPPGSKGPDGSDRAYLKGRVVDLGLDAKLGKRRLITESTPSNQTGGYWCDICACTLRDSVTWLDHINGMKHQKRLGFSMRVERSSVDAVKDRFARLKSAASSSSAAGAGQGGKGGPRPTLDADDRYAMAAMDNPGIHVASSNRWQSLPQAAVGASSGGGAAPASLGGGTAGATAAAAAASHAASSAGGGSTASLGGDDGAGRAVKRSRFSGPVYGGGGGGGGVEGEGGNLTVGATGPVSTALPTPTAAAAASADTKLAAASVVASAAAEDEDPDAAEMAAMMGFQGFGGGVRG